MGWTGGVPPYPAERGITATLEPSMPAQAKTAKPAPQIAVIGIDIGKNVFHLIGLDKRGAIVLKCKLSRSQLESRFANLPSCLIGMEACVGSHHLSRRLIALGHDARLMPAKYVPCTACAPAW
jgi:transposase